MREYFIRRVIFLFLTLWGITFVSFMMLQIAPGSPLEMKLSKDKSGGLGDKSALTAEAREIMKKQYHLDKPFVVRYALWLKDILRFDFGTSFTDYRPVADKIRDALPVSLTLGISSILVALFFGIPLGILAALRHGTWIDRTIAAFTIGVDALPTYVLGILLLTFFAGGVFWDWFPIYGMQSDNYEQLSLISQILDRLHHFTLPIICYSLGIAYIIQQQRASLIETLSQDYIRTARAKGLDEKNVIFKHAFRNSLIPIVTIFGSMLPAVLGGSIIIETLFSIPGLGLLAYDSLLQRDYPTIMANFTIFSFLSLAGIFLSDLLYVVVDPRIDFSGDE